MLLFPILHLTVILIYCFVEIATGLFVAGQKGLDTEEGTSIEVKYFYLPLRQSRGKN